ncbi:GIY-YIG nuclease family protein [Listeria monocytogenes]|nr:GIY-YIG nuclease family protein [Listeria monocytogenes]EAE2098499.1 GIY-YIG nuclease family protein [Listeria monocytogenes]EAE2107397.1 GIY-YIG nuclease family protein [Listeria monocytogenes]
MNKDNRKELIRAYKEKSPDAGVYRFISTKSGKSLIDNTMDLKGIANKLAFGVKIGAGNMLPPEMVKEAKEYGIDTIQFEILEKVDIKPEMTKEDIKEENDVLLSLWLEREDI